MFQMVLSLITVPLSKLTEEPLQPSVDSDHLRRSAPPGSLEMAFVLGRRCLSCAFGIVQREREKKKRILLIQRTVKNLL